MSAVHDKLAPTRDRGSVAVEAALIITLILIPLLAFILLFGRYFWYYTVAQKAAHDAAITLASSALVDIRSNAASALVAEMIGDALGDLDAATAGTVGYTTECWYRIPANSPNVMSFPCSTNATPAMVRTSLSLTVSDPFLAPFTGPVLQTTGFTIATGATVRYVGR